MSIYDNNKELLSTLGVEGNYSTDFEVRKAILNALGGDASMCNSIYEVDLQILKIYQEGGGLGLPEQTKSVTYNTNGTYTVTPDEGYTLSNVDINVNVTTPTEVWKVPDGVKFSNSTFTSVPTGLDFSNVTDFYKMFTYCDNLTTIPQLDTSNGTDFSNMFLYSKNLTTIPLIDTSKGTIFNHMFSYCSSLTSVPLIDTSNGTNFNFMFNNCNNLTEIPQLDTSKGTNFSNMFYGCSSLTTIPQLDTSNGTNFSYMFQSCKNLTTVPQLDTSKGTNFNNMFYNCHKLTTIPQLDTSKGTNLGYMFIKCSKLENITFIGSINANIDFSPCLSLTYESVKSILTACSNITNTNSKTVTFSRTLTDQNGELAALVATCNSKGWTVSGLTLE